MYLFCAIDYILSHAIRSIRFHRPYIAFIPTLKNGDFCSRMLKEFDPKTRICIHGLGELGSGISIGGKDFVIVNPDFCTKECACEYLSDALDAINPKCDLCGDPYSGGRLSCEDPRCPYVKLLNERKRRDEIYKNVVKRDGGIIMHVIKTCNKFYFGR